MKFLRIAVRSFLYREAGGYKPWVNEPFAAAVAAPDCARHWNARAIQQCDPGIQRPG